MKTLRVMTSALFLQALLTGGVVEAMDGVFDRSAEVAQYMHIMKFGSRAVAVDAAKEIYVSGISDPQLAEAVSERLLSNFDDPKKSKRVNAKDAGWIAKALASFGIDRYADTLQNVVRNSGLSKFNRYALEAVNLIPWHRAKNEIMASREYQNEGDNPRESQLLNLVMTDDPSMRLFAAECINREKRITPRLTEAMATQVRRRLELGEVRQSSPDDNVMAHFIKLIGYASDVKYQPLLESVASSINASPYMKRQANDALKRLEH